MDAWGQPNVCNKWYLSHSTSLSLCLHIAPSSLEKMNLQVGGPTNTIVLTENRTGVTLIMDLTLYQLGHASTGKK